MDIYNDILSYIQFLLEFKQVKTFIIKSGDYLIVSYYLLLILHKTQKLHNLHFGNHSRI